MGRLTGLPPTIGEGQPPVLESKPLAAQDDPHGGRAGV
jgi:hypothetical protein